MSLSTITTKHMLTIKPMLTAITRKHMLTAITRATRRTIIIEDKYPVKVHATSFKPVVPRHVFVPGGEIGYITFKRTYSRNMKNKRTEEWSDTLSRVINGCITQLKTGFTDKECQRLFHLMYTKKCLPAGRFLWQLGTGTVDRYGLSSMQNCAFTIIDKYEKLLWIFDLLMLGVGVGFNVQRKYIMKLPHVHRASISRLDSSAAMFVIPDSREGWVELLKKVLDTHLSSDASRTFTYSTEKIRKKGTPLKTFGGIASGPGILCKGIAKISDILNVISVFREGVLTSVDMLDIINIIGEIVKSGNVRRSAQIAIGDGGDKAFLRAKRWDLGDIPNHRANSNNSVICNDIVDLPEAFWDGFNGNGECYGLINTRLARSCGRIGEEQYPDPEVCGTNPCGEQFLADGETCCLAELFLPHMTSREELWECCRFMYRICKHSLALPCHHKRTENIVHKNMRIGIGVTGYMQCTEEQKQWLPWCYEKLRTFDLKYSREHGFSVSIKLTTVKPSGTLSLVAGVTPGVHPGFSPYYRRRIRFASNSLLIPYLIEKGYEWEYQKGFDGKEDISTTIIGFPVALPKGTICAQDMSAVKQLEMVGRLNKEWSDNSVSCSVYFRKEEVPAIKEWLRDNYAKRLKSVSFILHSEHGFTQAPYEEITAKQYHKMVDKIATTSRINSTKGHLDPSVLTTSYEDMKHVLSIACVDGECSIR